MKWNEFNKKLPELNTKVIAAMRDVCKHDMIHVNSDSHYKYYECDKCGYLEKI